MSDIYYARGQHSDGVFSTTQGSEPQVRSWAASFEGTLLELRRLA